MARRRKRFVPWVGIPIAAVGVFLFLSIYYLIDPILYRNIIQKSLSLHLGREVTMGQARISLWGGIGIVCENVQVRDRSRAFNLFQSRRLILRAKFFPLLERQIRWKSVLLDGPVIHLEKDEKGRLNFLDGPLDKEGGKTFHQKLLQSLSTIFGGSLTLRDGEIIFSDKSLGGAPLITEIKSFGLLLSEVAYHRPFAFRVTGKIGPPGKEGLFSISGMLQNISEELDLSKSTVKGKAEIQGIDTAHFWPYLKTLLPMKALSGMLDLNGSYEGDFSGVFKTSAKMKLREVVFDYPEVFAYVLTPKWVTLGFQVEYHQNEIKVPQASLELPDIGIKAKGRIYGIGSKEMGMEAEAQSGLFDLSDAKKFIPYRIITPEVSDPLFRGEGRGPVQILSVKLSGRMPEIDHCDQLPNAHTLSVKMNLGKVRLRLPWDLPATEDLRGDLVFEDGNLHFKEVNGKILHSRIDGASGVFYRLLLVPDLQVSCRGRLDLIDLPALAQIGGTSKDFSKLFSPISILSGRAEYRLTARGELKSPLQFQHRGSYALSRVTFAHRDIPFPISIGEGKIDLSNEDLQWSGVKVEFGDSSLVTNGSWGHRGVSGPFDVLARGRVDLKNLHTLAGSPSSPEEIRRTAREVEKLSGMGSFIFKARRGATRGPFSWEGELTPRGVNLVLKGASLPLAIRQGTFSVSNLGVNFGRLRVQFGNSLLTLDGSIREGNIRLSTNGSIDLSYLPTILRFPVFTDQARMAIHDVQELNGEAEVRMRWIGRVEDWITSLKEGEIRMRKVYLRHQSIPLPLSDVEGSLLLSPNQLQFRSLKGRVGGSFFNVFSAEMPRSPSSMPEKGRHLSFEISSSVLDLDLLFPERAKEPPASFDKIRDWLSHWSVEGKIEADQAKYHGFICQDLKTVIKTIDGKLFFRPFQFRGAEGDLWGEGWIEPTDKGIRFEIKPRLSNMKAEAFIRAFLQKGRTEAVMTTGRVHIDKVEIRGEGEDFQKVQESLNGSLRLEMENGVIKKFSVLSKIFSILNVSQLFKGRLPDLTAKGLPYHRIMAHIQVKDGVASTEDFVIDSDAIRITLLGKFDVGKKWIDAKIGIHPLITLDTVLSNIPVAGYIITGKDKAFISFIYEVKGDVENPEIEAIPIKSMGEGVLGIIKRLLETPLRPFQKTSSER